ncbi:hypothetical protein D4S03_06825 [bacterium]|nr:MAG: hypothetical protein D4S03_06825 [bacterium]
MSYTMANPYDITKAVDFTDQQIKDYWVDMPGGFTFCDMAKPRSAMPMIILGGKGSGKTHLMRYFSYPIQKIIHEDRIVNGIKEDGYLGIYLSCGGLNASRFNGKGIDPDTWNAAYAYYMDLWLTRLTLSTIRDAFQVNTEMAENEKTSCEEIVALFDQVDFGKPTSIGDLLDNLAMIQRELDIEVNNCAITHRLNFQIRATPGRLVFGVPQILVKYLPSLRDVTFLYLIDEFENLSDEQQKYLNTLVRERQKSSSIKIGARLYGVKTLKTFADNEENKEGSEFEYLRLDEHLRSRERQYNIFAKQLVARRLQESGYAPMDCENRRVMEGFLSDSFQVIKNSKYGDQETKFVEERFRNEERPYFRMLRKKLQEGMRLCASEGVSSESDIDRVIQNLSVPEYPLLEKVNILLLYKDWSVGRNLLESSINIRKQCIVFVEVGGTERRYKSVLDHFRSDMMAQLLREFDQKQRYLGIDTFIDISQGLPRNLLVILKNIFKWAIFNDEVPFQDKAISHFAQREGLNEASEWFFNDARAPGGAGKAVRDSIDRLSTLFRDLRFSDKPSECSLVTFSADISHASEEARRVIDLSRQWSLLIYVGEQRHRNTKRTDPKYQLNCMLAPKKDLPISRRGTIDLSPEELNAVFNPASQSEFEEVVKRRKDRMSAPFWGKRIRTSNSHKQNQSALFDIEVGEDGHD